MFKKYLFIALFSVTTVLSSSNFGTITTGNSNGTYIKIGQDISTIFQKYDARLKVHTSEGSIENLDILTNQNPEIGASWAIVQSDALDYYRFLYFKETKEEVTEKIKTILPLYTEHIHVFAKKGKVIDFSKGAVIRASISSHKSGSNITANLLENIYKVNFKYSYNDFQTALQKLENDKIDIIISVISFPNKNYQNLSNVTLVNLPINKVMNKKYIQTKFLKSQYKWLDKDINGYKVPSVIVTNKITPSSEKLVSIFLKIIFREYSELKKSGDSKWKEAYTNKKLKVENIHPAVVKILNK